MHHDSAKFLSGGMTPAEVASYEAHLEECPACQRRLEESSGSADDWQAARQALADYHNGNDCGGDDCEDGYSGDAVRLAEDRAGLRDEQSTQAEPGDDLAEETASPRIALAFLAPSDDPAMLGRVGPYEIVGVVGRGGAGIVLKGYDRSLGRNVAVKVLDPALAGVGAARQRFFREAKAMAAVSHEHVAPIYEVSEHAELPYLVMEYVPGGSLERRLREHGPFDPLSIVRIGLQTAQALAAAHQQGLVHRDIKPGNILLDRGTERVRVADFGLARVANDVSFTKSGFIAGTPQFMSPEQVRAESCDGQSDLFSLGAVMYALCTGHAPFRAETVYGVMQRIVHDEPRSIREQNALIPAWLEQFIFKLLSKDRAQRFASADETAEFLHEELAHLQNPTPASVPRREWRQAVALASAESSAGRQRSLARLAGKRLWIGAAAMAGAAMLAGAWLFNLWQESPRQTTDDARFTKTSPDQSPDRTAPPRATQRLPVAWDRDGSHETFATADRLVRLWRSPSRQDDDRWEHELASITAGLSLWEAELAPPPANEQPPGDGSKSTSRVSPSSDTPVSPSERTNR